MNYTPGPWFWDNDGSLYNYVDNGETQGFDKEVIGAVGEFEGQPANAIPSVKNPADRRLIQVAPQILDALTSVVKTFEESEIEEKFCEIMNNLIGYVNEGVKGPVEVTSE